MNNIYTFFREIKEAIHEVRRQLDIHMSLQRYIARSRKQVETRKVIYE